MTIDVITTYGGSLPDRDGDREAFSVNADTLLTWMVPMVVEMNTSIGQMNTTFSDSTDQVTYAEEWAQAAVGVAVSTDAGGNGTTDRSALHHAAGSKEWAGNAINTAVSTDGGGDGSTTFSAFHWGNGAKDWAVSESEIPTYYGGDGSTTFSAKYWSDTAEGYKDSAETAAAAAQAAAGLPSLSGKSGYWLGVDSGETTVSWKPPSDISNTLTTRTARGSISAGSFVVPSIGAPGEVEQMRGSYLNVGTVTTNLDFGGGNAADNLCSCVYSVEDGYHYLFVTGNIDGKELYWCSHPLSDNPGSVGLVMADSGLILTASGTVGYIANCYDSDSDQIILLYSDLTANTISAVVCAPSAGSLTFGTPVTIHTDADATDGFSCCYDSANSRVFIFLHEGAVGLGYWGTVSGTSISFGSSFAMSSFSTYPTGINKRAAVYDSDDQSVIVAATTSGGNLEVYALSYLTDSSASHGSAIVIESGTHVNEANVLTYSPQWGAALLLWYDDNNTNILIHRITNASLSLSPASHGTLVTTNTITLMDGCVITPNAEEVTVFVTYDDTASDEKAYIYHRNQNRGSSYDAIQIDASVNNVLPYADMSYDITNGRYFLTYLDIARIYALNFKPDDRNYHVASAVFIARNSVSDGEDVTLSTHGDIVTLTGASVSLISQLAYAILGEAGRAHNHLTTSATHYGPYIGKPVSSTELLFGAPWED